MAQKTSRFPAIPEPVTSFGAAVLGDALYTYGGHTGDAHSYSDKEQSNQLRRLDLAKPAKWETVALGPRLQGLALVAAGERLYRIGGFQAKNEKGKKHDLESQAEVAAFNLKNSKWEPMPPLPEPRSSHDAAVLEGVIYVVGGWQLQGEDESTWHKTAWRLNPADKEPRWQALPAPPFQRRALALAAHAGKLYAIGGMQPDGPTTRVDIFDPKTNEWSRGPDLDGKPMEGFGSSAFQAQGKLYVSTYEGRLQRLADDGKSWLIEQKLPTARFFHRMLPLGEHEFLIIGGANMGSGKFDEIDVIDLK
jgi:N-acetylneuraminic acid mutarotase